MSTVLKEAVLYLHYNNPMTSTPNANTISDTLLTHIERRWRDIRYEIITNSWSWARYLQARVRGLPRRTILFYPEKPSFFHALTFICNSLGYTMTDDPKVPHDLTWAFKDVTSYEPDETLVALLKSGTVVNGTCTDIGKVKVECIFKDVFGYGMQIDPEQHQGVCVRKSNDNAKHDGTIIT